MRIMAIDPSTTVTGWAIIVVEDGIIEASTSGFIDAVRQAPKEGMGHRLHTTYRQLAYLAKKHEPIGAIAIEAGFVGGQVRASLVTGYARGIIYMLAAYLNVECFDYAPASVKKSVAGSGRADKKMVNDAVRGYLAIDKELDWNESDALAVGLTHLARTGEWDRMRTRIDNDQIVMPKRGEYAV